MSFYLMHRGWMENRIFEREPYNRRNAWQWLIENAAFAASNGLERGQLRVSLRFMANAWEWTEPKVRRFLSAAQDAEMIRCVTDAGRTLITICNYEKYQPIARVCEASSDAALPDAEPTQDRRNADAQDDLVTICNYEGNQGGPCVGAVDPTEIRRRSDANLNKKEERKEDSVPIGTRQSARQITERMVEVWKEVFGSSLASPSRHNENRIRAARARFVGDFSADIGEWRKYLERIRSCPWLMGSHGWRADFDWVLKPTNLTKVLEGRYDQHVNGTASQHTLDSNILPFGGPPTEPPPIPEGGFFQVGSTH